MKNFNNNLVAGIIFLFALSIFSSCSKDNNELYEPLSLEQSQLPNLQTAVVLSNAIKVENEMLVFNDIDEFRSSLLALNRLDPTNRKSWEEDLGFTSMQTVLDNILQAEFDARGVRHTDLYLAALSDDLIVTTDEFGLFELNIFNRAYAPVLNEKGLLLINSKLYQFSADHLKIWENPDLQNIDLLLNTIESNESIKVVPIKYEEAVIRNVSNWEDGCTDQQSNAVMRLTGSFLSDYVDPEVQDVVFIDYSITIHTFIRTASIGWIYDQNANYVLSGNSLTNFTVTDGNIIVERSIDEAGGISGTGGMVVYLPEASGEFTLPTGWTFLTPGRLMSNDWRAKSNTSNGTLHECEIVM